MPIHSHSYVPRKIDSPFFDRVVLIIGASSGMGAEISRRLSHEGAKTILVARNTEKLKSVASSLAETMIIKGDISQTEECTRLLEEVGSSFGYLDHIVISSGLFINAPLEEVLEAKWDEVINTNLKGPFYVIQKSVPFLKKGIGKSIVVLSSSLAHVGAPKMSVYCASKGGLSALVRALAVELAPLQIRINAISPGHVNTPMITGLLQSRENYIAIEKQYPLGRIGTPENIAGLVLFLLSSEASWITGVDYIIDGGRLASG